MKKSLLLGITWITLVALTATTLYAQTVAGTSLVDKMKAVVGNFTLSASLNPGETGLQSAPIAGKKTGSILTAGEWNRVLELLGQGGGGGSGWVDVPLTDTSDFDTNCEYRFQMGTPFIDGNWSFGSPTPAGNHYYYATYIAGNMIAASGTYNVMHGIPKGTKNRVFLYWLHGTGVDSWATTKIEKLCGGGGSSSGGSVQIVEWGIIKTSAKTISNWDLITLEWSWNWGSDAAPSGGYIYKLNGQPKLAYVEASGISKDITLTTTAQNVHNLTVKLSGDSVVIDPSTTNTLAYVVWKFGGGSGTSTSGGILWAPDYDSGWIDFGLAGNPTKKKFTHNLGTEDYIVQMEGRGPGGDDHNCPSFINNDSVNNWLDGGGYWNYYDKTSTSVSVMNYTNSLGRCSRFVRVKLWKYQSGTIAPYVDSY